MRIIPSAVLRDAANASERFEKADAEMRRQWPTPDEDTVKDWNAFRTAAEVASLVVKGATQ